MNNENFYFENKEDGHSKFWAISLIINEKEIQKQTLVRKWGRVGVNGRSMSEHYSYEYLALQKRDKLIQEKIVKGYLPIL